MAQAAAGRGLQKLFVGNLPWTVGHLELKSYFQQFGKVLNANVVFDKKTGSSKGYGFVIFTNKQAFLENLEKKPQHLLEGNLLTINQNKD